jgi:hypothetical protein
MRIGTQSAWNGPSIKFKTRANSMLSPEMYAVIGSGAVLPYLAEAIWNWLRERRRHHHRARRPE